MTDRQLIARLPVDHLASRDARFGSQSMTGRLERVLVRPPLAEDGARWREYGWRAAPDHAAAAAEHEAFRGLLEDAGAEVVVSGHDPGNPDAIYVYDPVLVGDAGAVLLRPGKEGRRGEPDAIAESADGGRRPDRDRARRAGGRRRRGHRVARPGDTPRRDRLPHEPGCGPRPRGRISRCAT